MTATGMSAPVRLQLSRRKGFRLTSPNGLPIVNVARPRDLGNPFTVAGCRADGHQGSDREMAQRCVESFTIWLGPHWREVWDGEESKARRTKVLDALPGLRGHNVACWCKIGDPCHGDIYLKLANQP